VGCARPRSLASQGQINLVILDSGTKIRLILKGASAPVSEIKLIRTDTTLDLSQKAEKVCCLRALEAIQMESVRSLGFYGITRMKSKRTPSHIKVVSFFDNEIVVQTTCPSG
jgi:hypothetical protein